MTERGYPSWYSWLVVVLLPIFASVAVLVISLRVNERSIERERAARIVAEQQAQATRQGLCEIYGILNSAYKQSPPPPGSPSSLIAMAVAREVAAC